ncbi:PIN-like domain-containing protein [Pseudomonas sp. RIT288]|jgi:hypothetical protein|uniref:PIN-like domain-containing protein n=1 Tax=Pseudomonas sp. RIT288 TaxID=1470589 RepID=UPI00044B10A2|nr:PIN-like domain-containing protein [Pseudomonas sp. RIT288]EZP33263.1 hypothetical protein BW33_01163 [Pseudomonas sp. RIT288]
MTNTSDQIDILLKTHCELDQDALDKLWEKGTFVFDSNVLLDLYRLPQEAKNELLSVLRKPEIKNRIWIAFQGLLEFLNNRHDAIGDQKSKFETVRGKLRQAISSYEETFKTLSVELAKLKLRRRHSLINPEKFISTENIATGINFVYDFIDELNDLEKKQRDVHDEDETKKDVLNIFQGKIGRGLSKKQIADLYLAGESRYKNEVPPGYKDKNKPHSYFVLDVEYKCKFGDLLFWHEVIDKAKIENLEYVILVTGDVKEDWWLEKRGKKLGPRKELLNEIYTNAPSLKAFHMYDTSNFLRRIGERFTFNVSESTISETENLLALDRDGVKSEELVDISEILAIVTIDMDDFTVAESDGFTNLPLVKVPLMSMYNVLSEIIHNAKNHSSTKAVYIDTRLESQYRTLRFSNAANPSKTTSYASQDNAATGSLRERAVGLDMVRSTLAPEGIHVETTLENNVFTIEIFIPITKFQ